MQVWRDMAVREKVLCDEHSAPYLQRRHVKVATTGFATVGQAAGARASKGAGASIYSKILECRECESQQGKGRVAQGACGKRVWCSTHADMPLWCGFWVGGVAMPMDTLYGGPIAQVRNLGEVYRATLVMSGDIK